MDLPPWLSKGPPPLTRGGLLPVVMATEFHSSEVQEKYIFFKKFRGGVIEFE